jgi:hypothetical protein
MEISRVKELLSLLAEGIDPVTGEVFPADSPYQQPEIIRALYSALRFLEADKEKPCERKALPAMAGVAWTAEEEEKLKTGQVDIMALSLYKINDRERIRCAAIS